MAHTSLKSTHPRLSRRFTEGSPINTREEGKRSRRPRRPAQKKRCCNAPAPSTPPSRRFSNTICRFACAIHRLCRARAIPLLPPPPMSPLFSARCPRCPSCPHQTGQRRVARFRVSPPARARKEKKAGD